MQTAVLPELKHISLNFKGVEGLLQDRPYLSLDMLDNFSHCNMLEVVEISFPSQFWERADLGVMKRFFAAKSQVKGIRLSFDHYYDDNCAVISQVIECVNSNSLEWVILEKIKECNTDLLRRFIKQLQDMGLREYELECAKFDSYTEHTDHAGRAYKRQNWKCLDLDKDNEEAAWLELLAFTRSGNYRWHHQILTKIN